MDIISFRQHIKPNKPGVWLFKRDKNDTARRVQVCDVPMRGLSVFSEDLEDLREEIPDDASPSYISIDHIQGEWIALLDS